MSNIEFGQEPGSDQGSNQKELTEELQAELDSRDNRSFLRRAVDRVRGGKESPAETQVTKTSVEVPSERDSNPDLDALLIVAEKAGGDSPAIARRAHQDQKSVTDELSDVMTENGYSNASGILRPLPATDHLRKREPHGVREMQSRADLLQHAIDGRLSEDLGLLVDHRKRGPENEHSSQMVEHYERETRLLGIIPAMEKRLTEAMKKAVEEGEASFQLPDVMGIVKGSEWDRKYQELDRAALRDSWKKPERDKKLAEITKDDYALIEGAKWRAVATVQALTGAGPILGNRSQEGDPRRMDMDPTEMRPGLYPQYPLELAEQMGRVTPDTLRARPIVVDVHLGLDLVLPVQVSEDNGRIRLTEGKIRSQLKAEDRQEMRDKAQEAALRPKASLPL